MGNTTFTSMGNIWDGIKNGFSTIGTWAENVGESVSDGVKGLLNFFPRVIDDMNKGIHRNTDGTINWIGSEGVEGYNWDGSPKIKKGYRLNRDTKTVEFEPNIIEKPPESIPVRVNVGANMGGRNFDNNTFGDQVQKFNAQPKIILPSSTDRYGSRMNTNSVS